MKEPILCCGDSAVTVQLGESVSEAVNRRVTEAERLFSTHRLPGITEVVPTYTTVCIHYDPLVLRYEQVLDWIRGLELPQTLTGAETEKRLIRIPVCYGGDFGPDLAFVAKHSGLTEDEVIRRHCQPEYLVYMLGFLPGFAYLGGMDDTIACPRLLSPRTKIPAGSVGIAGSQTGIYPLVSPGGWQLIGRTPYRMLDLREDKTEFRLSAGDFVKFYPISESRYREMEGAYD